jgi:hypothetical protein
MKTIFAGLIFLIVVSTNLLGNNHPIIKSIRMNYQQNNSIEDSYLEYTKFDKNGKLYYLEMFKYDSLDTRIYYNGNCTKSVYYKQKTKYSSYNYWKKELLNLNPNFYTIYNFSDDSIIVFDTLIGMIRNISFYGKIRGNPRYEGAGIITHDTIIKKDGYTIIDTFSNYFIKYRNYSNQNLLLSCQHTEFTQGITRNKPSYTEYFFYSPKGNLIRQQIQDPITNIVIVQRRFIYYKDSILVSVNDNIPIIDYRNVTIDNCCDHMYTVFHNFDVSNTFFYDSTGKYLTNFESVNLCLKTKTRCEYSYDLKGNIIHLVKFNNSNEVEFEQYFEYNSNNDKIVEINIESQKLTTTKSIEYEYW